MTSKKKKKKKPVGDWKEEEEVKKTSDEYEEIYAKSQQKLLAKSKIYEKMERGEMEDVQDVYGETRYLVDFDQKTFDRSPPPVADKTASQINAENIYDANEEYRENLQAKWKREQEEILNAPVHYENIKFDEVRDLGTGYYAFSKNEEERQKQMDELKTMREETISIQKKKEQLRHKRKAALDTRLMKVKQRKATEEGRLEEFLEQCEKEKQAKEEKAKPTETENIETDTMLREIRQSAKPSTSQQEEREWDKGKFESGFVGQAFVKENKNKQTTTTTKTKKPSYEQRIDTLRTERPDEFAPPSFY